MHPENAYIIALVLMAAVEWVFFVLRRFHTTQRHAFGRITWVLVAVAVATILADGQGLYLPTAQLAIHMTAFVAAMAISRNLPGHFAASLFLPLASVDLFQLVGAVSLTTWWWGVYYIAFAQLIGLAIGADLHPFGRTIRAWGHRMASWFEFRAWAHQWKA
jgi:hypothetical protein